MFTFLLGGSGSGKSAFAEELIFQRFPDETKYYIATMEVYGEEGFKRVERHLTQREGKGFVTLEYTRDVGKALPDMQQNTGEVGKIALLECLSNLVANEMFVLEKTGEYRTFSTESVVEKVWKDINLLNESIEQFYLVSNNVFEEGTPYDEDTGKYMQALGELNTRLAKLADHVVEVVAGIPCVWKGNL